MKLPVLAESAEDWAELRRQASRAAARAGPVNFTKPLYSLPPSLHRLYMQSDTIGSGRDKAQEASMQDFWFLAITLAFFALALGYTHGCDRL